MKICMWLLAAVILACTGGAFERSGKRFEALDTEFPVRLYLDRPPVTPFFEVGNLRASAGDEPAAKTELKYQARLLGAEAIIEIQSSTDRGDFVYKGIGIRFEKPPSEQTEK